MTAVIARDATATDQLVYAWPFPLGPEELDISCGEDEIVVMCPSWLVGDRLGPGRHRWRTPDPTRPVGAYFVSTSPVETSFDVTTSFVIPATQQTATLRAQGSIIVRCVDPGLLIAQFVGLPFDNVNDGLLRSVTRSSERLIARVLTRRTVMGQTVAAVTDPGMLPSIIEELVAYNPAAGAVFGVEFVRLTGLYITTADTGWNTSQLNADPDWSSAAVEAQGSAPRFIPTEPTKQGPGVAGSSGIVSSKDSGIVSGEIGTPPTAPTAPITREDITTPGMPPTSSPGLVPPPPAPSAASAGSAAPAPAPAAAPASAAAAKEKQLRSTLNAAAAVPAPDKPIGRAGSNPSLQPPNANPTPSTPPPIPRSNAYQVTQPPPVSQPEIKPPPAMPAPTPLPPITPPLAAANALDGRKGKATLPSVVPPPGSLSPSLAAITPRPKTTTAPPAVPLVPPRPDTSPGTDARERETAKLKSRGPTPIEKIGGATPSDGVPLPVMGIGMGGIGMGGIGIGGGRLATGEASSPITSEDEKSVKGEIVEKLDTGSRVLVPGADGRLVSATIRQEQSGYYELEIGGSGETLWVPRANVVADK